MGLRADHSIEPLRKIENLTADIRADAKVSQDAQRLQIIPGISPITVSALTSVLSAQPTFSQAADFIKKY